MQLNHVRLGSGDPLVLIHGIGSQWQIWRPVLGLVAREREVIALDMPGFGASPPLPEDQQAHAIGLAAGVAAFFDEIGLERAHLAGNSLGGWVSMELAKLGRATRVTGICAAGFWGDRGAPRHTELILKQTRWLSSRAWGRRAAARTLARDGLRPYLGRDLFARPERVPYAAALEATMAFGTCAGWDATVEALEGQRFRDDGSIDVPVTLAWGEKDVVISKSCRLADEIPAGARVITMPGWGHVPTYDDPDGIARLLLES